MYKEIAFKVLSELGLFRACVIEVFVIFCTLIYNECLVCSFWVFSELGLFEQLVLLKFVLCFAH